MSVKLRSLTKRPCASILSFQKSSGDQKISSFATKRVGNNQACDSFITALHDGYYDATLYMYRRRRAKSWLINHSNSLSVQQIRIDAHFSKTSRVATPSERSLLLLAKLK